MLLPDLSALRLAPTAMKAARRAGAQGDDGPAEQAEQQNTPGELSDDLLAVVLSMIAFEDPRKHRACEEARATCATSTAFRRVCATDKTVWVAWSKAIFASPDASETAIRRGEGLMYNTFYDERYARSSFRAMCEASAIADITSKLFVLACYNMYLSELSARRNFLTLALQNHHFAQLTLAGRDLLKRYAGELKDVHALIKTHEPVRNSAQQLLVSSELRPVFAARRRSSPVFQSLFDVLCTHALSFVFSGYGFSARPTPSGYNSRVFVLHKVVNTAHVLGTYVVCLEKLEADRQFVTSRKTIKPDGQGQRRPHDSEVHVYAEWDTVTKISREDYVKYVEHLVVETLGRARQIPLQARLELRFEALTHDLLTKKDDELSKANASIHALDIYIFALRLTVAVAVYEIFKPKADLAKWVRGHAARNDLFVALYRYVVKDGANLESWDRLLK